MKNMDNIDVLITNLNRRFSGVSGTINLLLPVQSKRWGIGFVGAELPGIVIGNTVRPDSIQKLSILEAILLSRTRLPDNRKRIWHVRRDPEMMAAVFVRDILRFPIMIVFTSAAKYRHSWISRMLIAKMNAVIATTNEAAQFVSNTTKIIPHGISLERYYPPENKKTIWSRTGLPGKYGVGIFGRVRPNKGIDIFVDAMIKLLPLNPEFTAVIVGFCDSKHQKYQSNLVKKIKKFGLRERIVFLGELPTEQVPEWYQNVLIAVACPRQEQFGVTPLEAMASGCAVVASDTGAFRMIVDEGQTGSIVSTGSVNELTIALSKYMVEPERAISAGVKGRKRAEEVFSIENEADRINMVYTKLWADDLEKVTK
jgi:mannosyltransferase